MTAKECGKLEKIYIIKKLYLSHKNAFRRKPLCFDFGGSTQQTTSQVCDCHVQREATCGAWIWPVDRA